MKKYEKLETYLSSFNEEEVRKNAKGDETRVKLAERLCVCLDNKGWKAIDLAKEANISKSSISTYMSGDQCPSISLIVKLAKALEVSTDFLLGLSDLESPKEDLKTVYALTGLSDEAIIALKEIYDMSKTEDKEEKEFKPYKRTYNTINYLLANENRYKLFIFLANYLFFKDINRNAFELQKKSKDDNIPIEQNLTILEDVQKVELDKLLYKIKEELDEIFQ